MANYSHAKINSRRLHHAADRPSTITAIMHYNLNGLPLPIIMNSWRIISVVIQAAELKKTKSMSLMCDANVFIIINDSIWFWCDGAARTGTVTRKLQGSRRDFDRRRSLTGHSLAEVNEWTNAGYSYDWRAIANRLWNFVKIVKWTKIMVCASDGLTQDRRTAPEDNYDLAIHRNGNRNFRSERNWWNRPHGSIDFHRMPNGTHFHRHLSEEESTRETKGR